MVDFGYWILNNCVPRARAVKAILRSAIIASPDLQFLARSLCVIMRGALLLRKVTIEPSTIIKYCCQQRNGISNLWFDCKVFGGCWLLAVLVPTILDIVGY